MSPEEIAAKAAQDVARHESDSQFLRTVGAALETEAARLRSEGLESLNPTSAAVVVANVSLES